MTSLNVRPFRETDIPAIVVIYAHAVLHGVASFEVAPPDAAEMTRRIRAVVDGGYPYLVAEKDGQVLGYAYASAYRMRPAYRNSIENSVYVSPNAHRLGVGRALLKKLIETTTGLGFRQMIAVIGDSGNAGSIGLHRALGFTFCGTIHSVGYKHGRWLDSVIMQRALGPGDTTPPGRNDVTMRLAV
jgi:L-amino acid N-acyltransferase YncA